MNPAQIAAEDQRLEQAEHRAGGQLAQHRWHWTLDEANPERTSFLAYARLVNRDEATIRRYANGWASYLTQQSSEVSSELASNMSPADHIARQGYSEERRTAIQSVADAHGISFDYARQQYRDEIDRVQLAAQHEAESNPQAAPDQRQKVMERAAKNIVTSRSVARDSRERLGRSKPALAVLIDGELGKSRQALVAALNFARSGEIGTMPPELAGHLQKALDDIEALLQMVRTAIGGGPGANIDWDAELARLGDRS